uniref:pyridoxal kinase n=1 Tax=Timspurckia oligopyrenoides TaxID=708627 RepID=A0A6T6LRF9_9RHOD|mmetsp:Transcript_11872/g.21484  ORF Transcript_11872/g.21484 Transcript_11872/m.21484 type:complete len:313 (+) Transcript_11872:102-1040(+)
MSSIGDGARVLSIQSHVVSGYVGNKSAVFPLQLLGFEVDVLNSVQFSNHTGYTNKWKGTVVSGEQLLDLISGLNENQLLNETTHLLTGYIGSESFLKSVVQVDELLLALNPNRTYVCDPVLGDHGALYVPKELIEIYISELIHRASILTPNAFELELLSKQNIRSESDVISACCKLHLSHKIPNIVVTSVDNIDGVHDGTLRIYSSSLNSETNEQNLTIFEVAKLPGAFTGSGDVSAALILAHSYSNSESLANATEFAMASVNAILKRTHESKRGSGLCKNPELKLIQSAHDIIHPPQHTITKISSNSYELK